MPALSGRGVVLMVLSAAGQQGVRRGEKMRKLFGVEVVQGDDALQSVTHMVAQDTNGKLTNISLPTPLSFTTLS